MATYFEGLLLGLAFIAPFRHRKFVHHQYGT